MSFYKYVGMVAGGTAHATENDRGGNTHPSQFIGEGVVFSLPEHIFDIYGQAVAYAELTLFVTARPGSEGEVVLGTLHSPFTTDQLASAQVAFVRGRASGDVVGLESVINDTVTVNIVVKPTDSIVVKATKGSVHVGVMVTKIV